MCSAAGRAPNDHRNAIDQSYFPVHSALPTALHAAVEKVRGTIRGGDMGSRVRRALHRGGDAVNVASRLEGRTKPPHKASGVGILVGEVTRNQAKDVVFREIDRIRVKGKEEAVTVYEPLDSAGDEVELRLWEQALMSPAPGLCAVYLARLEDLRQRRRRNGTA